MRTKSVGIAALVLSRAMSGPAGREITANLTGFVRLAMMPIRKTNFATTASKSILTHQRTLSLMEKNGFSAKDVKGGIISIANFSLVEVAQRWKTFSKVILINTSVPLAKRRKQRNHHQTLKSHHNLAHLQSTANLMTQRKTHSKIGCACQILKSKTRTWVLLSCKKPPQTAPA